MRGWLVRVAAATALAALAGLAVPAAYWFAAGPRELVRSVSAGNDWLSTSPAWFTTSGLYSIEYPEDLPPFAWTRESVLVRVPRLDRRIGYRLTVVARGGTSAPLPVALSVDGARPATFELLERRTALTVDIPAADARDSAFVTLTAGRTFVPGPRDTRTLGFIVEAFALRPETGRFPLPTRPIGQSVAAAALYGAGAAIAGCSWPVIAATAVAVSGWHTWLLVRDAAFLCEFPDRFVPIGVWVLVAGALIGLWSLARRQAATRLVRTTVFVIAVVTLLRLILFLHPNAPIGDSMFQAHRADNVAAGNLFFTSVTPPPYFEFPYAPGMFVLAVPFWKTIPNHVGLLRGVGLLADVMTALAVLLAGLRVWRLPRAACAAALLYMMAPVGIQTLATGNLSNAFAQSVVSAGLLFGVCLVGSRPPWFWATAVSLVLAGGFMSHFGTVLLGPVLAAGVIAAWSFGAERDVKVARGWFAFALALAIAAAYLLYYQHFQAVYETTIGRILAGETSRRSMVPTVSQQGGRVATFFRFLLWNYSFVLLAAAAAGLYTFVREKRRDALALALWGWLGVCAVFAVLGILTPIEVRATLAVQPFVALAGGFAVARGFESRHLPLKLAAGIVCAGAGWVGIATLVRVLIDSSPVVLPLA
jgi:hypothetical protein